MSVRRSASEQGRGHLHRIGPDEELIVYWNACVQGKLRLTWGAVFNRRFRTEAGEVAVLDAFCPHMGAHLGHGGKVEGGGLVCPFHAWKFDGAGKSALPVKISAVRFREYPVPYERRCL